MDRGESVEYEPVSVKEILVEMKDTAELLIDLSYSAVLFDDSDLASEVLELEHRMDVLQRKAWMSLVMAGRRPAEAGVEEVFETVTGDPLDSDGPEETMTDDLVGPAVTTAGDVFGTLSLLVATRVVVWAT